MSGLLTWDTDSHSTISSTAPAMASRKAVKYKQLLQNKRKVKVRVKSEEICNNKASPKQASCFSEKEVQVLLLITPYFSPFTREPKNEFGPHKN